MLTAITLRLSLRPDTDIQIVSNTIKTTILPEKSVCFLCPATYKSFHSTCKWDQYVYSMYHCQIKRIMPSKNL